MFSLPTKTLFNTCVGALCAIVPLAASNFNNDPAMLEGSRGSHKRCDCENQVDVTFTVSEPYGRPIDPEAVAVAFVQNLSNQSYNASATIPLTSFPVVIPLSIRAGHKDTLNLAVKIYSPNLLETTYIGNVAATLTTNNGTTTYDLNPNSGNTSMSRPDEACILQLIAPLSLL